jgi:hypothetical protein
LTSTRANQYAAPVSSSRVVQSAQAFLQGYLYVFAQTYGTVVAINSTGAPDALGRSLGPSDLCPAYTNVDGNNVTDCKSFCGISFSTEIIINSRGQRVGACRYRAHKRHGHRKSNIRRDRHSLLPLLVWIRKPDPWSFESMVRCVYRRRTGCVPVLTRSCLLLWSRAGLYRRGIESLPTILRWPYEPIHGRNRSARSGFKWNYLHCSELDYVILERRSNRRDDVRYGNF